MNFKTDNPKNYMQFGIPTAAKVEYTYVGGGIANDKILTATYKNRQGEILGVLTFTYDGGSNIASIERTA